MSEKKREYDSLKIRPYAGDKFRRIINKLQKLDGNAWTQTEALDVVCDHYLKTFKKGGAQ